jgi:hypothetical protein
VAQILNNYRCGMVAPKDYQECNLFGKRRDSIRAISER